MPSLDTQTPVPRSQSGPKTSAGYEAKVMADPSDRHSCAYSVFDHRIQPDEPPIRAVSLTSITHKLETSQ
jgi:hypothetical protein